MKVRWSKVEQTNGSQDTLNRWHRFRSRLIVEGAIVGMATGFAVVAYRWILTMVMELSGRVFLAVRSDLRLIVPFFLVLILISWIIKKMITQEPLIKGSGIPQVEAFLLNLLPMKSMKIIMYKIVGSVLSIGSGLSLGREGPSIQLGASVGKGISSLLGRKKIEERFLVTGGATAGLAAAFNAPLAGVMFSLEEVHKNFSPLVMASTLVAAVSADYVSKNFFGLSPVMQFGQLESLPLHYYHYAMLLGILMGFLGVLYNRSLLHSLDFFSKDSLIPKQYKMVIPFLMAGVLALVLPEVLGGGHHLLMSLNASQWGLGFLAILILVKFVFTMFSYGSGAPGGIFLPLLVLGGLVGKLYGSMLVSWLDFPSLYVTNMIIYAMLAYFTAIVRAPITGIILISEMTGSLQNFLPLSLVAILSYLVADLMDSKPIYESLLARVVKDLPVFLTSERNKTLLDVPVYMGSSVEGKAVKDIVWPKYCLVVGLKRGQEEIIPKGDTVIKGGDSLVILATESRASATRKCLENLLQDCDLTEDMKS